MNQQTTKTVELTPAFLSARSRFNAKGKAEARPALTWQYSGYEPNCPEAIAVNSAVESFGRKLIAQHAENWDYSPTPETCNLSALILDLEAERTYSRVLTKETLAAAANYYMEAAQRILGKSEVGAKAGAQIIAAKCAACAGKPDIARVLFANLVGIVEGETDTSLLEPHMEVIQRLADTLAEYSESAAVDAEAL